MNEIMSVTMKNVAPDALFIAHIKELATFYIKHFTPSSSLLILVREWRLALIIFWGALTFENICIQFPPSGGVFV
jgi:hypothetical protein